MGFSRQEYWSGLPFPPPGDLPDPVIKPTTVMSPALVGGFFTTSVAGKPCTEALINRAREGTVVHSHRGHQLARKGGGRWGRLRVPFHRPQSLPPRARGLRPRPGSDSAGRAKSAAGRLVQPPTSGPHGRCAAPGVLRQPGREGLGSEAGASGDWSRLAARRQWPLRKRGSGRRFLSSHLGAGASPRPAPAHLGAPGPRGPGLRRMSPRSATPASALKQVEPVSS